MIKEIIFITYGDSSDASTWSNVPFLFTKTLENKGVLVHRVNIDANKWFRRLFDKVFAPLLSFIFPSHEYNYLRSRLLRLINNRKLKKNIEKYYNADLCLIANFDYYNKFNKIPTLLFSDWTYDILIKDRLGRDFYFFEKWFSQQQDEAISKANFVISLFPECAAAMKHKYPHANIHYLGSNVINFLYTEEFNSENILNIKRNSKNILFIGGKKYKVGAQKLVNAFSIFFENNSDYKLHLIGIKSEWITVSSKNVICYGYLRKDDKIENEKYYELLINARFIVNPTPIWAGYSSMIEAMFFYTPVITTPYKDFVAEFGNELDFGLYLEDDGLDSLVDCMEKIASRLDYKKMCKNAHDHVEKYSWDNYVDKIINLTSLIK